MTSEIKLYDGTSGTLLKRAATDYNLSAAYTSRRIIGLPSESRLYDGISSLMAKTTYAYDEGDFNDSTLEQNVSSVIQHDNSAYGASFVAGRGNMTSMTRHDVTGQTSQITSSIKYNTAGGAVAQITPGSQTAATRTVKISYADSFNDTTTTRNTYAYPTKIIDPAGNYSEVKYRFDTGANVWAKSPAPIGNTSGKETAREFDAIGRLLKETLLNTGAYTRYDYTHADRDVHSKVYSIVVDTNGNGADSADEVLSEAYFDGAGRVLKSRNELPNGWSGQKAEYDILGQIKRQTIPTEINAGWSPTGNDQIWLWTQQEYDWKGRVTKIINTDGTFKTMSYEGCGCAGGEETTVEGEEIKETDWQGNATVVLGKRKQKIYSDILGRTIKSQIFNWNGGIYSTITNDYNGRNQLTRTRHYEGDGTGATFQEATFAFDGHGRLLTRHTPEQAANTHTSYEYYADDRVKKVTDARGAATSYEYEERGLPARVSYDVPANNENLIPGVYRIDKTSGGILILGNNFAANVEVIVGEQRAENGYQYQELARYSGSQLTRGTQENLQTISPQMSQQNVVNALNDNVLTLQIVNADTQQATRRINLWFYSSNSISGGGGSGETIAPAAEVTYEYDAAGNRTLMRDELGTVTYQYDQISRMTVEERHFSDMLNDDLHQISYTYGLSGQLKTITNPFNATVTYNYDKAGRLTEVNGTNYGISTPFVSNVEYRAWGAIKSADYGYGGQLDMTYDARLRPTQYKMTGIAYGTAYTRGANYNYYADGQLKTADDLSNDVFDKSYKYDQAGRLKEALSGFEARGESMPPNTTHPNRPYRQTYAYDVWGNRTGGEQKFWRADISFQVQNVYTNNRSVKATYDADGRDLINSYNAAGRSVEHISRDIVGGYPTTNPGQPAIEIRQTYDGDGMTGRREQIGRRDVTENQQTTVETTATTTYSVRSTVLGGKPIVELNETGAQTGGYIYAAGALLAKQTNFCANCPPSVIWQEANPLTGSRYEVDTSGGGRLEERDPLGANTGGEDPYEQFEWAEPKYVDLVQLSQHFFIDGGGDPFNPASGCELDGMPMDCGSVEQMAEAGALSAELGHSSPHFPYIIYNIPVVSYGAGVFAGVGGYAPIGRERNLDFDWRLFSFNFAASGRLNVDEGGNGVIVKEDCVNALKGANQDIDAVKRATANLEALKNATRGENVLTAELLAAIAVRESGFQNRPEIGGGGGKGVFQITYGKPSQEVLNSVELSAKWVLDKLLRPAYVELNYDASLSLLGALRNYNAGGPSARGRKLTNKILGEQKEAGIPYSPEAFSYGTAYPGWEKDGKKYENGNYVENVLDIAVHCFDYKPPKGIPNP